MSPERNSQNNIFKKLITSFIIFFLLFSFSISSAAFNKQINYQGKLTDASNVAVSNGTYNMEFALYTVDTGGSAIWTETRTGGYKVQVTNGLFSVLLGEVTTLSGVNFNQTLYLGVNIGGTGSPGWDGEMTPRKKLGAVPAAVEAENATSATTSINLAGGLGGQIPYQSAAGTTAMLTNGTAGQVLQSNGTTLAPTWITLSGGGDMTLASTQTVAGAKTFLDTTLLMRNVANTFNGSFTNINTADRVYTLPDASGTVMLNPMTTGGDIIYAGASGIPTRLTNGIAGQVLQSNGTTLAPTWVTAAGSGANTALSNLAAVAINTDLIGAVAGGMGIRGGSAANDDLILEGTTNATRTTSYINLQPNGGNVGIGMTNPSNVLDVTGTFRASGAATLSSTLSVASDITLATNNTYIKGVNSVGTTVNLYKLTNDANNITRSIAGNDTGGFDWTRQTQADEWMKLTQGSLIVWVDGSATAGGGIQLTNIGNVPTIQNNDPYNNSFGQGGLNIYQNGNTALNLGNGTGQVKINGTMKMSTAISKIVPGATSLSLRNNADNADNLIITDAGLITTRNNLSVGGTITGTQLISNIATGTAPLVVTSTTPVANLSIGGSAASATTATNLAGGLGGQIPYQSAAGVTAMLANGTAGYVLQSNGTTLAPSWIALSGGGDMALASTQTVIGAKTFLDTTLLMRNVANTFNGSFLNTNTADRIYTLPDSSGVVVLNPMTIGGDIIYGGASGAPTRLPNGTAGQVLQSNGTTLAPTWVTAASSGANTSLSNLSSVAINTDLIGAVAGGMGIRGGTAANDDLILEGTTNATRTSSYVIMQPNGGNVGIGTMNPQGIFEVGYPYLANINLIPEMTSNTAPSGVASCSGIYNGTTDCYAAMKTGTNGWLSNNTSTGYLQYQFSSGIIATRYSIKPWSFDTQPATLRSPKTWTFEGSNDGSSWTVLDTQTNYTSWVSNTSSFFSISNVTSYAYYKVNVTLNGGNSYLGMLNLGIYADSIVSNTGLAVSSSGNVGIGKTNPGTALDVVGTVTATSFSGAGTGLTGTATSLTSGLATNLAGGLGGQIPYQSAAGITAMLTNGTAGQVLQSNGTTLAPTWVTASGGIGGSGTTNYLPIFTSSTSLGNSAIYQNGGNVGIGTVNPQGNLEVYGNNSSGDNNVFKFSVGTNDTANSAVDFRVGSPVSSWAGMRFSNPSANVTNVELSNWNGSARTVQMGIYGTNGNVGIGTTIPNTFKLEVAGSVGPEADNTRNLGSSGKRWANIYANNITASTGLTLSGFTAGSTLFAGASGVVTQDNANYFWDNTNKRLGIGTAAPNSSLTVSGAPSAGHQVVTFTQTNNIPNPYTVLALNSTAGAAGFQMGNSSLATNNYWQFFVTNDAIPKFKIGQDNIGDYMTILTGGNVGIGITNPVAMLSVKSTGTNDLLNLIETGGTEVFTVLESGNVGIGTTNPGVKLEVAGENTTNSQFKVGTLEMQPYSLNNAWLGENIYYDGSVFRNRATGAATLFYFMGNEGQFRNYDSAVAGSNLGAGKANLKISTAGFAVGPSMTYTAGDFSNAQFFVRGSDGNVGIGTTTPGYKLDVKFATETTGINWSQNLNLSRSGGTYSRVGNGLLFSDLNTAQAGIYADRISSAGDYKSDLVFLVQSGASGAGSSAPSTLSEAMRIDTNSNVGIGTATPTTFKLEVAGNVGPSADNTYNLGSGAKRWANLYATNVAGAITPTGFTLGSVVFAGTGGLLTQDNANFFWDDTNNRLGIGTVVPTATEHIYGMLRVGGNSATNQTGTIALGNDTPTLNYGDTGIYRGTIGGLGGANYLNVAGYAGIAFNSSAFAFGSQSTRMYIDGVSGNVGIGTITPTTFKLEIAGNIGPEADNTRNLGSSGKRWANLYATNVAGAITPTGFTLGSVAFAGTAGVLTQDNANFFWDDTNNRLGIGTTVPYAPLEVYGTNAMIRLHNSAMDVGTMGIEFQHRTANDIPPKSAIVSIGNSLGYGRSDLYFVLDNAADFSGYDATIDAKMVIKNTGNVGIGTTAPGAKLEVAGNGTGKILMGDATYVNYAGISLNGSMAAGNYNFLSGPASQLYINRPTGQNIQFRENNVDQMTILTGGNVGIGTTTPGTAGLAVMNGNVGIGTTAPTAPLSFGSGLSNTKIALYDGGAGNTYGFGVQSAQFIFHTNISSDRYSFYDNTALSNEVFTIKSTGKIGIGVPSPTAYLQIKAGTIAAGTSPLKFTSGPVNTAVEDGAMEYTGTHLYMSIGATRYQLDQQGSSLVVGVTPIASGTSGNILYNNAGTVGEMTTTGSGTVVALQTSPAFITPSLGVATATTINKVTITAPATSAILTIGNGTTLSTGTASVAFNTNAIQFAGGVGPTSTFPAGTHTLLATDGSGAGLTGTAPSLTAGTVTTNANLTGPITSVGNATSIASQTGTGTTFAMSASPTFTGTVSTAALTASGVITSADSVWINSGNDITTLKGILTLYGTSNTTTSQIMFKNTSGLGYGNHGAITGGYNTYFVMDTSDRGWIFRNATTATNVASISNTGVIVAASLNGTTGINTGAGAGTQRIDASGNLTNIGTIASGLINGQTISNAANFTGTMAIAGNVGIGDTTPDYKLDVKGNAQFDDTNTYTSYTWAGGTVQTNSIEILDRVGGSTSDGIYPTLTFHDYGNGGAQFSMEGSTTTLHLASGAAGSAGTLATGSGYFSKLKIWGALETTGVITWSGGNSSHLGTGVAVTTYVGNSSVNNALVRSNGNTEDAWIMNWGDSAAWGIYNRNIDSPLVVAGAITVPGNSTAFIGAGLAKAYIEHASGNAGFAGTVTAGAFSGPGTGLTGIPAAGVTGTAWTQSSLTNLNQLTNGPGYITNDTSVPKGDLANSGTLGFTWSDAEVSDTLTASSVPCSGVSGNGVGCTDVYVNTTGDVMSGNLQFSNVGQGIQGTYDSTKFQGIFAMGPAYVLASNGTTPGNLYGLAWTHSNAGGEAKAGLGHQMLVMENGITQTAIGNGIWTRATITAVGAISASNFSGSSSGTNTGDNAASTYALARGGNDTRVAGYSTDFYNVASDVFNDKSGNRNLTVFGSGAGYDAYMTFHVGGDFATYFGLGGAENDLVVGGWSMGNVRYRLLHSGNQPYAWAMNQHVTSGSSPSFTGTNFTGIPAAGVTGTAWTQSSLTNLNQLTNGPGYITNDTSVPKGDLANSGTLGFTWSDAEVSDTLTASTLTGLTLNSSAASIDPNNVTQNQIGYNTSVSLFGQSDGGLYSSAYSSSWIHQIYGDFRTGQIAIRGKNNGTWQAWRTVLDSGNYNNYSPTLTGGGASGNWAINAATATTVTGYQDIAANRLYDHYTGGAMYAYNGRIYNGWLTDSVAVNYANSAGSAGTAGGLTGTPNISVGTIQTSGNITVGASGGGKITVTTWDPPYTIDGVHYATYGSGMIGVKEEVTGVANVSEPVEKVGYKQVIDFKTVAEGSDLWLFSRAVDVSKHIGQMSVLLTPMGNARAWYHIDKDNYILTIYSTKQTEVSYRLTAPRFDTASWTNYNNDEGVTGLEPPAPNFPELVIGDPSAIDMLYQGFDFDVDLLFETISKKFEDTYHIVFTDGLMKVAAIITDKLTTKELCLEDVCINKGQLQNILANTNGTTTITTTSDGQTTITNTQVSLDTVPPTIALSGDAVVSLAVGDTYVEQGAVATDVVDGTEAVVISGNVDTAIPGVYTITYLATDVAGNQAIEVTRTVNVAAVDTTTTTTTTSDGTITTTTIPAS